MIIRTSEIGEFYYCCLAWYYKRNGIKRQSSKEIEEKLKVVKEPKEKIKLTKEFEIAKKIEQNLEKGIERHKAVGEQIARVEKQEIQINYLKYVGYGILAFIVILIIFYLIK